MGKQLTQAITNQITNKDVTSNFIFKINSTDYSSYLVSWNLSFDRTFGSAKATFIINNTDGSFGSGGDSQINQGDQVELIQTFEGDSTQFKAFFGFVDQRSINKTPSDRTIVLSCFDYISILNNWDIDLDLVGTKVKVENENLVPNYLPAPNDMFSQIFNFAHQAIAQDPPPILLFRDKDFQTDELQNDGFDVIYSTGQVKLGAPLNARDNYDFIAKQYYFYSDGLYIEDILETLFKTEDGYGKYLFGQSSSDNVVTNNLSTTYQDEEGEGRLDNLTGNVTNKTITIKHTVVGSISPGSTSIVLDSIDGLPASGSGNINGDSFTWSNIDASTKTLSGIPSSGSSSLLAHPSGVYLSYEATYSIGQVWNLTFSNVTTNLVASDFTIPEGASMAYFDSRNGRILLDKAISLSATVRCNYNYTFKTLQATGIQLNEISFKPRELSNRFDAIQKLKQYLAPNYVIRTQGDNKIWASYLTQKTNAEYTLNLIKNITYLEDEDNYTRVKLFAKNKNPTNIVFDENVDFSTTGESFRATATRNTLEFEETKNGWHVYKSVISDAGRIVLDSLTPIVYINGFPIDNKLRQVISMPVVIEQKTRTEQEVESHTNWLTGKAETDVSVRTYTYYRIFFPHQSIVNSQPIDLYNASGVKTLTISPNDPNMDYGKGIYDAPGDQKNSTLESIANASYYINFSTRNLEIDYDQVRFRISEKLLPSPQQAIVQSTYEYVTVYTPANGIGSVFDGRFDTQVQTQFFSQPPTGFNYAIIDLGQLRSIQAVDIVAGFFRPDESRKFDIDMRLSLQYSSDNDTYSAINDKTSNFSLAGGQSISFDEEDLGSNFQARYIKVILEDVRKVDYGEGVWPVAFNEIAIYSDIVLSSEAKLIDTTTTTATVNSASTTISVEDTSLFDDPDSGSTETAYIGTSGDSFTYTGKTSTSFTGCVVSSGVSEDTGAKIYKSLETDTTLYDNDNQLGKLGDRLYKEARISDDLLFIQSELDDISKNFLKEFYKEHTKLSVDIIYAPYLKVGQTVSLTDSYNNISDVKYFIESISDNNGNYRIVLARFP